ncbi:hypothetical protein LEP1GSC132_2605 [Leptospira kirschneri str. 200803703]|nr:hypothetical protein LEP1GSC044_2011 [Leptospira kirschneri serovar Grippotyphosa str. RM52]EKQ82182.1 hypothetical protein LEP1GSC064_3974 [Leptospira kirschneri serovar Grippotyphosa str. Moskva]EKR07108.1 hypothetical protein LEP1GSC122_3501 [Leptospira kirschneri serovar Valbuzzi str. 200702274]EMK03587.1 hypothetical protein LEP1GSC176_2298 [Leptospira kirschneri str. MMD1493]EMK19412.1 hypothetical protein LEP1GSC042_1814 [Leptospira kirschneri serovar Bim str. PUO 1247]EMN03865.1 hyp
MFLETLQLKGIVFFKHPNFEIEDDSINFMFRIFSVPWKKVS